MKILDRNKILDFMTKRKEVLDNHISRDFSGGVWERLSEQREVKYWKEAIERGEFDTGVNDAPQEVYIILSVTHPEIADFTFYTELSEVMARIDELNKLAKRREYWYITMYSNSRNSEKDGEKLPPDPWYWDISGER